MATRKKTQPKVRIPASPKRAVALTAKDTGAAPGPKELVIVTLDNVTVKKLLSRDGASTTRKREGTITFDLDGQAQSLQWLTGRSGSLKNAHAFDGQLLYIGDPAGLLGVQAHVIETDKAAFAKFQKKSNAFISFAATLGTFLPPYGNAITASSAFVKSLIKLFGSRVDDDVELAFYGSFGNLGVSAGSDMLPLKSGSYVIDRRLIAGDGQTPSEIELGLRIRRFKPLNPNVKRGKKKFTRTATVILDDVDWSGLDRKAVGSRPLRIEVGFGSGSKQQTFETSIKAWNKPALIDDVLGLRGQVVYEGPWIGSLPFLCSVQAMTAKTSEEVDNLIGSTATLAVALQGSEDKTIIENVAKTAQSFAGLAAEFAPGQISVGTVSGLVHAAGIILDAANLPADRFPVVQNIDTRWGAFDVTVSSGRAGGVVFKFKVLERLVPV